MFFLMGFGNGEEDLNIKIRNYCNNCNRFTDMEFFMTYNYFSLFFLKIFKWNKKYIGVCKECKSYIVLNKDEFEQVKKEGKIGDNIKDIHNNTNTYTDYEDNNLNEDWEDKEKICVHCGFKADKSYVYCPKCGNKL